MYELEQTDHMNQPAKVVGVANVAKTVEAIASELLAAQGYELVLVEYLPQSKILRLFIDHEQNGFSLDDCVRVSRFLSDVFDAQGISDSIGKYHLEVSSPGLDRPLVRPAHFQKYVGKKIHVTTRIPVEGRRRFPGQLQAATAENISMTVDNITYTITYDIIERAKLVPEFTQHN